MVASIAEIAQAQVFLSGVSPEECQMVVNFLRRLAFDGAAFPRQTFPARSTTFSTAAG